MRRVLLFVERLSLVAWVGMAVMFLSLLLGLRGSGLFSTEAKDNHPRVLFPRYYTLEMVMLGTAAVASLGGAALRPRPAADPKSVRPPAGQSVVRWGLALTLVSLALAVGDYVVIYRPLSEMLGRPPYPPRFQTLHEVSRWINTAILLLTLCSASLALGRRDPGE